MRHDIRTTKQEDPIKALDELSEGIYKPNLVIFFAPEKIFHEITEEIASRFPSSKSIGTTTTHTFTNSSYHTNETSAVFLYNDIECSGDFIPDITGFPLKYAQRIKDAVDRLSSTENTICLEFTTAYSNSEELVITALDTVCSENDITVVGGTAGITKNEDEKTKVALNGVVHSESTVFMCIRNLHGKIKIYKENVYVPTNKKFTATSVDIKNRIVKELDKKPAAEVLKEALGCKIEDLKNQLEKQPLGRITDNEIYISAIEKILPDLSTSWSSRIYNNTKVSLLKLGDYKTIAENTINKIKKNIPNPSLVFLIHCDARTNLYATQGHIDDFTNIYSSAFKSIFGFSSHGEQLGRIHFNLTLLAIAFE